MEGNFLSRYNNKVEEWTELIKTDPENKSKYESLFQIITRKYTKS